MRDARRAAVLVACAALAVTVAVGSAGTVAPRAEAFVDPPPGQPTLPLAGVVVVVDPGHNGRNWAHPEIINRTVYAGNGVYKACNTTGTSTRSGYTESRFTLDVARRLAAELRARGATVRLTRTDDRGVGPCITKRAGLAERVGADVLVSVHADGSFAPGARGFHVMASTRQVGGATVTAQARALARVVRSEYAAATGMPYSTYVGGGDALLVRRDLGTLNLSVAPAVMIEMGNMKHRKDARRLERPRFRERSAVALADAVAAFTAR